MLVHEMRVADWPYVLRRPTTSRYTVIYGEVDCYSTLIDYEVHEADIPCLNFFCPPPQVYE